MSESNGHGTADTNGGQGISVVHMSIPNSAIQVQPVIQTQPGILQNTGNFQTIQIVRVIFIFCDVKKTKYFELIIYNGSATKIVIKEKTKN